MLQGFCDTLLYAIVYCPCWKDKPFTCILILNEEDSLIASREDNALYAIIGEFPQIDDVT